MKKITKNRKIGEKSKYFLTEFFEKSWKSENSRNFKDSTKFCEFSKS